MMKNETSEHIMHEAKQYLLNPQNFPSLHVRIEGKKRRLFVNDRETTPVFGIVAPGKTKRGFEFSNWDSIEKILYPRSDKDKENKAKESKLVLKYRREAQKATFTNPFIRQCLEADLNKSVYENRITTGNAIDGQRISLDAIAKWAPFEVQLFKEALKAKRSYSSTRFKFHGYEGTLSVSIYKEGDEYFQPGDICGYFSKEYVGCGNGYYYILINDEYFIGNDVD